MPSDVSVFVRFKEKSVFAGEEFSCVITFTNVTEALDTSANSGPRGAARPGKSGHNRDRPGLQGRKQSRLSQSRSSHQANFSLNNPTLPKDLDQAAASSQRPDFKHQRSISIISIGSQNISTSPGKSFSNQPQGNTPRLGHHRSSTVQHFSQTQRRPSPGRQASNDVRPGMRSGGRSPLSSSRDSPSGTPTEPTPDFKFPPAHLLVANTPDSAQNTPILGPKRRPLHRTISNNSQLPGHRDSVEIYSHSNHSDETLMSEQPSLLSDRPQLPTLIGKSLLRNDTPQVSKPQATSLLMGYAQVNATFVLDASLVDQTPFEEVKKKGFLGGQAGGGVVGVKKKVRPSSGIFSSFGFSSLGESLESIMGGDNLSSVKEMKAVTNARSIPLLSTPQSLLFVDLHLEPGEEKSFSFTFKVPRGLPSSYRGKAIKITYNLTIGVQGAPGSKEMQAVRQVNVPIRVFSGVDSDGEIFGHDLMQPYVILKDTASTKSIEIDHEITNSTKPDDNGRISATEFLQYVDNLLDKSRRRQSSSGTIDAMFGTFAPEKSAAIRAINRAIMLSNQITAASESSPNRFEIGRGGLRIATVVLDRPLHRLGETVTTVIDLSGGQMTCTSLQATLESAERVSNSLAVRSASAISRITKKVYASHSENVLFAERAVFSPTIPASATPTFVTSGVNLEWYVKLEFGTIRMKQDDATSNYTPPNLLEEVINDERGSVNVAVETLECDTFEVLIPITVYGDLINDGKDGDDVIGIPI